MGGLGGGRECLGVNLCPKFTVTTILCTSYFVPSFVPMHLYAFSSTISVSTPTSYHVRALLIQSNLYIRTPYISITSLLALALLARVWDYGYNIILKTSINA